MNYKVEFMMKPKPGMTKKKFGTLQMTSKHIYKTKEGAQKEEQKLKGDWKRKSPYERRTYLFKTRIKQVK